MLLAEFLGSEVAEKTLLYLENYGSGYARVIAREFDVSVSEVLKQLQKFERVGLLSSRMMGRTRVYVWNPRYLFLEEVRALFRKALECLSKDVTQKYFRERTRRFGSRKHGP